jgi:hypothetical protein
MHAIRAIDSALSSGEVYSFEAGCDTSIYNTAYFGYVYGNGQSSYATIGLYGVDRILNVTGYGRVGVGTTTPSYNLDVVGTLRATSNILTTNGYVQIGNGRLVWDSNNNAICV